MKPEVQRSHLRPIVLRLLIIVPIAVAVFADLWEWRTEVKTEPAVESWPSSQSDLCRGYCGQVFHTECSVGQIVTAVSIDGTLTCMTPSMLEPTSVFLCGDYVIP